MGGRKRTSSRIADDEHERVYQCTHEDEPLSTAENYERIVREEGNSREDIAKMREARDAINAEGDDHK